MILPERLQGGEEVRELRPWLNRLRDFAASLLPSASPAGGIRIQHLPGGCLFSADIPGRSGGGGAATSSSDGYEGPFAVVSSGAGLVTVYSYNAGEGRLWESLIILGLEKIAATETEISASADSHVWIEITQSGGKYAYEIKAGTLPAQSDSLLAVPLAYIDSDSNITQMQFGNIVFPGRVF